jgi:hypothetical protein
VNVQLLSSSGNRTVTLHPGSARRASPAVPPSQPPLSPHAPAPPQGLGAGPGRAAGFPLTGDDCSPRAVSNHPQSPGGPSYRGQRDEWGSQRDWCGNRNDVSRRAAADRLGTGRTVTLHPGAPARLDHPAGRRRRAGGRREMARPGGWPSRDGQAVPRPSRKARSARRIEGQPAAMYRMFPNRDVRRDSRAPPAPDTSSPALSCHFYAFRTRSDPPSRPEPETSARHRVLSSADSPRIHPIYSRMLPTCNGSEESS